ncbi:MAG: hypothetical protein AB9917_14720 [Negativicutes bacterium]
MLEQCGYIMAVLQENRVETATKVQEVLTRNGCNIRFRLGVHDAGLESCSNSGLILLQVCGEKTEVEQLQTELQKVPHVKVKLMSLEF